jgi:hypothetical protein
MPSIVAAAVDAVLDPQLAIKNTALITNKIPLNLCILCPIKLSKIPTQAS